MSTELLPFTEEYAAYLHDETKTVGWADSISFPVSEAEIADVLRRCRAVGAGVTVQGNRTGLTTASVPQGGHILSLTRMCRVCGMRIDEGGAVYLRVQPGLSLGELRRMIGQRQFDTRGWDEDSLAACAVFRTMPQQYFTPDPTETSASLGGMVACNASGAKTYRYGPTRGSVSALRLVLSDGDVLALRRGECFAGGRDFTLRTEGGRSLCGTLPDYTMPACKNAAGYYAADDMDLIDLIIGSDGTLGVLSEIELRLIPLPKVIWGVNCFFRTLAQSVDFAEAAKSLDLAAIEFFDGHALDILRAYRDGGVPVPEGFDALVYVELHSDEPDAALDTLRALGEAMERCGGDAANTWCARSLHDRERLLLLRHKVPESVNALIARRRRDCPAIAKLGSDMAVPDEKLRAVLAMYLEDLAQAGLDYAYWGHLGNNHLHVNILPRTAEDMHAGKALFARWAEQVAAMGGTVSAEHGVGRSKRDLLLPLYGARGQRQMAAVKRVFDPDAMLGRGNLFPEEYLHEA